MKLGVLAAALFVLAGCGGEADIPTMESEIKSGIEKQMGLKGVTVDCPDQMDWNNGRDFHCVAEDRDGQVARVTVSMENDDGEWSWAMG